MKKLKSAYQTYKELRVFLRGVVSELQRQLEADEALLSVNDVADEIALHLANNEYEIRRIT